jgi:hypothetical protein
MTNEPEVDLIEVLIQQEREGWAASGARDGDWYRANCTRDAFFVLPGMVLDREQCAEAIESNDVTWMDYAIEAPRLALLSQDAAVLSYRCYATREGDDEPYVALISSAYVQRDGVWLLAFHQQTPLGYVIEAVRADTN